jgi:hypothetical protein
VKASLDKHARAAFDIPPDPPAEVADIWADFDRIGETWGRFDGARRDTRDAVPAAVEKDKADGAAAISRGEDPPARPGKHQVAAEKAYADAVHNFEAADRAVDEAGNRLAQAIARHRDEWVATVAPRIPEARARLEKALDEAEAALRDLGNASHAVHWLENFDVGQAIAGHQPPYIHGKNPTLVGLHDARAQAGRRAPASGRSAGGPGAVPTAEPYRGRVVPCPLRRLRRSRRPSPK